MVKRTRVEIGQWQQALKTIARRLMEEETLEQELDIESVEPQGCEGVGGGAMGGAYFNT